MATHSSILVPPHPKKKGLKEISTRLLKFSSNKLCKREFLEMPEVYTKYFSQRHFKHCKSSLLKCSNFKSFNYIRIIALEFKPLLKGSIIGLNIDCLGSKYEYVELIYNIKLWYFHHWPNKHFFWMKVFVSKVFVCFVFSSQHFNGCYGEKLFSVLANAISLNSCYNKIQSKGAKLIWLELGKGFNFDLNKYNTKVKNQFCWRQKK